MRRLWQRLADPALWPNERLFFEMYGQALQAGRTPSSSSTTSSTSWLEPHGGACRTLCPPTSRSARGPTRPRRDTGLLLDLLATGDRAGADATIEQAITLFETWRAQLPTVPSTNPSDPRDCGRSAAAPADEHRPRPPRALLVSGSLRRTSTDAAVLRTTAALAPDGVTAVLYDTLAALPHFNPDDDVVPLHPAVIELPRADPESADAVLFSTPEYAGALPGSFKNLLDWTIGDDQPGRSTRSPSPGSTRRSVVPPTAHDELRTVLGYARTTTIVEPACTHIPVASALIGDDGLVDDPTAHDQDSRSHSSRS